MKIKVTGEVGKVYTTETGMNTYDFDYDEGEYTEGWEQITPTEREKVRRKRLSHMCVMWLPVKDEEVKPMSHRTDGMLF